MKSNFITINLRKNIINIFLCLFILCLLIFSKYNIQAAKDGLKLWVNSIVPSLFPFFFAIELLNTTNIPLMLGKIFSKIMKPLFNVPGIGAYIFAMGLISGYPTGAKLISSYRKQKLLSKVEAERLITFTNNSGALFILGTVGITMFKDYIIGLILLTTHILSCITVGIIFRFWKKNNISPNTKNDSLPQKENKKNILNNSIISAINTCLVIGGFIVLFSIIISILNSSNIIPLLSNTISPILDILGIDTDFSTGVIYGIIELTNGIFTVTNISNSFLHTKMCIVAFLLGFGGISVILQIYAIIEDTDISITPYIIGKLMQGTIASIYTLIIIKEFNII